MEFDIESWVPYGCDFKPVTTNSLFSDTLGRIADLALRIESEFLYMETQGSCPVGTLVPENLIRPHLCSGEYPFFAMVFSYSQQMEKVLYDLSSGDEELGAGITICSIWKKQILLDECKVLIVASESPLFNAETFQLALSAAMSEHESKNINRTDNITYFAERFGYRRYSIPYETDNVTELLITGKLADLEFADFS